MLCLLLALLAGVADRTPDTGTTAGVHLAPDLAVTLQSLVADKKDPRWRVSIAIVSCTQESLLFGFQAARPLIPASNQKLLVTAGALECWNDTLVRWLDSLFDRSPRRRHLTACRPAWADSHGLNDRPDFPGYRHLVLANRESDNMEAEWMLAWLARRSRANGHTVLDRFLKRQGIPRAGLVVWDACGLARRNRVSALTLARLLARVDHWPQADVFPSTLARPGEPGTLIHRNLSAGPRLAAKTGYIRNVFALSGYLRGTRDTYAFSFILNNCASGTNAYRFFETVLSALDNWDTRDRAREPSPDTAGSGN